MSWAKEKFFLSNCFLGPFMNRVGRTGFCFSSSGDFLRVIFVFFVRASSFLLGLCFKKLGVMFKCDELIFPRLARKNASWVFCVFLFFC